MGANKKFIYVYHTHIEVYPYTKGENENIERMMSVWVDAEYRYEELGFYILEDVLYLPRGFNLYLLQKEFNSTPIISKTPDEYKSFKGVNMIVKPRNRIQKEAIDFLLGRDEFVRAAAYSQQALLLDTGDGKTYTMIHALVKLKMRAMIIAHQDKIKTQWIDQFLDKTDIDQSKIINISGATVIDKLLKNKLYGYIYVINHQTLNSYAKSYGWEAVTRLFNHLGIGVKVYDEAHLSFKNVLRVDMFTNTVKTYYLTANFDRSSTAESNLFNKCFSSVYKFGEETKNYEEKRKHIVYVPVLYRSHPSFMQLQMASNAYGFSVNGFSGYALHDDLNDTMLKTLFYIYSRVSKLDGRILITTPKIADTYYIKRMIEREFGVDHKKVATVNSNNTKEENEEAKEDADVIVTTIKSCGTGYDLKRLRCIINMEPFSSNITANQLSGRLREYAPNKDTYFFDLIDIAFKTCENQYKVKLKYLRRKCKEVRVMKL